MKNIAVFLILGLVFTSFSVNAVRVPALYEAEVPVSGQQANSRRDAIGMAMKMVLVKLTGDRNAPGRTALIPVIETAEKYVQQYRYVEVTQPSGPDALGTEFQLRLRIRFDESNLNNALRDLGIQVWGRERPSILVWMAMQNENVRKILNPEEDPDYFSIADQTARTRGIVLMFPLFDLEDSSSLRVSDIWGGFQAPVLNASRRYYPDTILTGRIESLVPGIWEGSWTAYIGEDRHSWTTEGSYPEAVFSEGVDGVADLLAVRFAQGDVLSDGDIQIKVLDVNTVDQYARALGYLESLSTVARVEVKEVSHGNIVLILTAHGGGQAITQAINFGRVLEQVAGNNNTYRLLP